jgi:hypothetical protein
MSVHDWVLDSPVAPALARALLARQREHGVEAAYQAVREGTKAHAPPDFIGTLSGEQAGLWIAAALAALEERIDTLHELHQRSAYWWMWSLRRVPDEIFADPAFGSPIQQNLPDGLFPPDASAPAYRNRIIAEAMGGSASRAPQQAVAGSDPDILPTAAFAADEFEGFRLAMVVGFSIAVGRFMTMRLMCSGGAVFTFTGSAAPNVSLSGSSAITVLLGEWRLGRQARLDRLGIHPETSQDHAASGSAADPAVLLLHRRQHPVAMLGKHLVDGLDVSMAQAFLSRSFQTYFRLERYSLKSFADLLRKPELRDWRVWHPDLPVILGTLLVLAYAFHSAAKPRLRALIHGYIALRRSDLVTLYDETRTDIEHVLTEMLAGLTPPIPQTCGELIVALTLLRANPMVLMSGPGAVETDDGWVMLNFSGLSERFAQVLEYPGVDGAVANVRGRAFEVSIQDRIDATSWCPPESLRKYVNADLKKDGRTVGEVDAIAHNSGVTILISAKSIAVGDLYILGDYAARREAARKVIQALERWRTLMSELLVDLAPGRRNFDFSGAGQIVGLVTTPNALSVPVEQALRPTGLSGLPEYVSVEELMTWLHCH